MTGGGASISGSRSRASRRRSARRNDQDPLPGQVAAEITWARRGGPVDVDVAPPDRTADVLGHEPAAADAAIRGHVDATAQRNQPRIDGDAVVVAQRPRRSRSE